MPVPPRGILSRFVATAATHPRREFLDYVSSGTDAPERRETFTYGDFAGALRGATEFLRAHGVGSGDSVALLLRNSPEMLAFYLAALEIGAHAVPLDASGTAAELSVPLRMVDAKVLLVRPDLVEAAERLTNELAKRPLVLTMEPGQALAWARDREPLDDAELPEIPLDDIAVVVFTSGTTTARPKGVMLTHRNVFQGPAGFAAALGVEGHDRVLVVTPMHHVNALQFGIGAAIVTGASVCLVDRFSAHRFWSVVNLVEPTVFWTMGGILSILLARDVSAEERRARGRLRAVFAAAVGSQHEAVRERIAPVVMDCYGLTEFSGGTCTIPGRNDADDSVAQSVGTPLPHLTLMVVDPVGRPVPMGETGEIVAVLDRSNVMAGYLGEPELNDIAFRDGLLWTGDLGFVGPVDRQLHFVGRSKDVIRRGGVNISAMEVEAVLESHASVISCAVVPAPDRVLGEAVVAFVAVENVDEERARNLPDELRNLCRRVLSRHKVPTRVFLVDSLPRTATGKIRKHELRHRLASLTDPLTADQ